MLFEDSHVVCTHAEIMLAFIKALPLHIVTSAQKPIFTGFLGIPISQLKVPGKAYQRLKIRQFQYNTLGRWVAGTNDSSTKHLMFQVFFFLNFLQNSLQK